MYVDAGGNDSFTKLLLHGDQSPGLVDSSGSLHSITATGSAAISTTQFRFGGASIALGAAGNFLTASATADWNFGTGDFTVDFLTRMSATIVGVPDGTVDLIFIWSEDGGANNLIYFLLDGTDIQFFAKSGGVIVAHYKATHGTVLNTWYHFEFVRSGTSFFIFKDGVSLSLTTTVAIGSNAMPDLSAQVMRIGGQAVNGPAFEDEVRISKGIARHTANFSPYGASYD